MSSMSPGPRCGRLSLDAALSSTGNVSAIRPQSKRHQIGDAIASDSQTPSITATCIEYVDDGRRPGLKIPSAGVDKPLIRDQMMVSVSPAFLCTVSVGQDTNQLLF
jgi:hypothetical protein